MHNVTIVIPNWNGEQYLKECLDSLMKQSIGHVPVIVVDNGSEDDSRRILMQEYAWVKTILLDRNYGFCRAVNEGIKAAKTKYVILLNNDIKADPAFVEKLIEAMDAEPTAFSCQAKLLQMSAPTLVDDAGNYYSALGWARARGKGKPSETYTKRERVFSACAGAAIYRRELFEKIGYFDEKHFAYLEDVDLGYRARIAGFSNFIEPAAIVYHKGSASTGSKHNSFKVFHAARNNVYLIYKNMSRWQILINLPFLFAGWVIKFLFFLLKGLGFSYLKGLWHGILFARAGEKVPFLAENFDNCCKLQLELWKNIFLT